jgi:hypothetical protein
MNLFQSLRYRRAIRRLYRQHAQEVDDLSLTSEFF